MHKNHNYKTIDSARCPNSKCKKVDFIKEKCKDDGCGFVNTRSIPCKCADDHVNRLRQN